MDYSRFVYIVDTETTGFNKDPENPDRVLEIGIIRFDRLTHAMMKAYHEVIRYEDIDRYSSAWVFKNTDLKISDIKEAKKDLKTVSEEVRELLRHQYVTSYNVPFDFYDFLFKDPWDLETVIKGIPFDIMDLATDCIREMCARNELSDKLLQTSLIKDWLKFPDKWVRSINAYNALCPKDEGKRNGIQSHRALDDCYQEGWVLRKIIERELHIIEHQIHIPQRYIMVHDPYTTGNSGLAFWKPLRKDEAKKYCTEWNEWNEEYYQAYLEPWIPCYRKDNMILEKCCKCGDHTNHPVCTPWVGKFYCENCAKKAEEGH